MLSPSTSVPTNTARYPYCSRRAARFIARSSCSYHTLRRGDSSQRVSPGILSARHSRRDEGISMTRAFAAAILVAIFCTPAAAQPQIDWSKLEITTTHLGAGVYLLNWQGGDSLILVEDEGVVLVDTSVAAMGDKIKAAIA